jgi:hypothetical protein
MPNETIVERISYSGNKGLIFRKWNNTQTAYDGEAFAVSGLVTVTGDLTQDLTPIAADDNPRYKVIASPYKSSGTVEIIGCKYSEFVKLLNVTTTDNGSIIAGGGKAPIAMSMSWEVTRDDGTETDERYTRQKFVFYNVIFSNIPTSTKTGDTELQNFTLNYDATFVEYAEVPSGKKRKITWMAINELDNPTDWAAFENDIVLPNDPALIPAPPEPPPEE